MEIRSRLESIIPTPIRFRCKSDISRSKTEKFLGKTISAFQVYCSRIRWINNYKIFWSGALHTSTHKIRDY